MNKSLLVLSLVVAALIGSLVYADQITPRAAHPQDIYQLYKDLVYAVNNKNLLDANLGFNASSKAKIRIASGTTAICNGVPVAITATNTILFSTSQVVAAGNRCIFAVGVNASGVFSTKQSQIVTTDAQLVTPLFDNGVALLGTIKVVCAAGGGFTPNTTALDAANNTVTFTDMYSLPVSLTVNQR